MPSQSDPNTELTPEAVEVLKMLLEDLKGLKEIDLADTPPSTVFEAD